MGFYLRLFKIRLKKQFFDQKRNSSAKNFKRLKLRSFERLLQIVKQYKNFLQ